MTHEPSLTPTPFYGTTQERAKEWLNYFRRYVEFKQLPERASLALFALLMRDTANTWFTSLTDDERADYNTVLERFTAKYAPHSITLWRRASDLWSRDQRPGESVEVFCADMRRRAQEVNVGDEMFRYATIRQLRSELHSYV